jgi:hypothetical protein
MFPARLLAVALAAASLLALARPAPAEPPADLDPTLKKLGNLVGGTWVTEAKGPDGMPVGEFRWEWERDGRTLRSTGKLGGEDVYAVIGWDAAAKKVYYLDRHGPGRVFFGHAVLEGEDVVFDFSALVGPPARYQSRERFPDPDSFHSVVRQVKEDGTIGAAFNIRLKRVR